MRHLDDAIRRLCGGAPQDFVRARTVMANAIVASMLPDGVALGRVKSGEVSIADALEAGKGDPVVGRIKAKRLLMALPGIGAAKAQSAMTAIGISETRRVAGIGQRQAEKLIELFG